MTGEAAVPDSCTHHSEDDSDSEGGREVAHDEEGGHSAHLEVQSAQQGRDEVLQLRILVGVLERAQCAVTGLDRHANEEVMVRQSGRQADRRARAVQLHVAAASAG